MMRSLYAGVSGMQNHQIRMDVIGNNISNVNTTGFKKGRVLFQDMLSQSMSGAAKPTDTVGGVNPKQIGLGMVVAAIDTIHTQGSFQTTGKVTDLALSGEGFFILRDGEKLFYTRAGAFDVDRDGTLINPANGLKVQGWVAQDFGGDVVVNTAANVTDIVIPVGQKDPAKATTLVKYTCNLNKDTGIRPEGVEEGSADYIKNTWESTIEVFDSYGRKHLMRLRFTKDAEIPNRWRVDVVVDPNAATGTNTRLAGTTGENANQFIIDFANDGTIQSISDPAGNIIDNQENLNLNITFDVPESNADAGGNAYTQTMTLDLGMVGMAEGGVTQFAQTSTTKAIKQDGYTMGYLESFKIDQNGMITGVYSNGNTRILAQIAMASFTNPAGLEKAGDSTFVVSNNSGIARIGASGTEGKGKIISGALEMSNVDLAETFTDMIVTQRGFQANSRTITTADQMIQELLSLKR